MISAATEFHTAQALSRIPQSQLASAAAGHDPGVVKTPRRSAPKSCCAFGKPLLHGNDVRIPVVIPTRQRQQSIVFTTEGLRPAVTARLGTRGARSWSREDTQPCSCKVLLRIGKSLLRWQRCSYTGGNRNPSEAAEHCLHDGRIVSRGAYYY